MNSHRTMKIVVTDSSRDIGRPRDLDEHVSRRQLLELAFGGPGGPLQPGCGEGAASPRTRIPAMTVASSAHAVLVAIRRGVLSSIASSIACWRCPTAAALVVSRVSPASVSTSSGTMAKTSRLPTERMLTPCSGRDETVPGCAVVDDAIEEVAGSLGALRRRPRQDRGAENGDRTIVVAEEGRPAPGVAVDTSCDRSCAATRTWTTAAAAISATPSATASQPHGKIRRPFAVFHDVLAIG